MWREVNDEGNVMTRRMKRKIMTWEKEIVIRERKIMTWEKEIVIRERKIMTWEKENIDGLLWKIWEAKKLAAKGLSTGDRNKR